MLYDKRASNQPGEDAIQLSPESQAKASSRKSWQEHFQAVGRQCIKAEIQEKLGIKYKCKSGEQSEANHG